ncbi:hypothetical protein DOY81_008067 [Sarcophaga bullata]|nr:hypothetical protein DOY81_008067 [Sarcophaga bullata]
MLITQLNYGCDFDEYKTIMQNNQLHNSTANIYLCLAVKIDFKF